MNPQVTLQATQDKYSTLEERSVGCALCIGVLSMKLLLVDEAAFAHTRNEEERRC